jgi:hypothetical protein
MTVILSKTRALYKHCIRIKASNLTQVVKVLPSIWEMQISNRAWTPTALSGASPSFLF